MMSKQAITTRGITNTSRRLRKLPSRKNNHSWNSQRSFNTNANGSVTSHMFHGDNGDDMSQFDFSVDPSCYHQQSGSKRSVVDAQPQAQVQQQQLPEEWELMSVDESLYYDRSTMQGQPETQQELEEVWKRTRGMLVKDTSIPKLIMPIPMSMPGSTLPARDVGTIHEDNNDIMEEDESDEMDLMGSSRNVFQQMQRQQQQQQQQQQKKQRSSSTRTKLDAKLHVLETHLDVTEEESMTNSHDETVTIQYSNTEEVEIVATPEHEVKPKKQRRKSVLQRLFGSFFSSSTKSSNTKTNHKKQAERRTHKMRRQSAPTLSPTDLWNSVDVKSAPSGTPKVAVLVTRNTPPTKKRHLSTPVKIAPKELWNDLPVKTNNGLVRTNSMLQRKNNAKQRRRRQSAGMVPVSVDC